MRPRGQSVLRALRNFRRDSAGVVTQEIDQSCLSLSPRLGGEDEKLVEEVDRYRAQHRHRRAPWKKAGNELLIPLGDLDDVLERVSRQRSRPRPRR